MSDTPTPLPQRNEERAVLALRALLEPLPHLEPQPEPAALRGGPRAASRRGVYLVAAAAAVFALMLLAQVLMTPAVLTGPASGGRPAVIPDPVPHHPPFSASVSASPVGPALFTLTYDQRFFLGGQVESLVSADGQSLRRIPGGMAEFDDPPAYGVWSTTLLSPDGTTLALGTNTDSGAVILMDLPQGSSSVRVVRPGSSTIPVAWSSDSRSLFVVTIEGPAREAAPEERAGQQRLERLDVQRATGRDATTLPLGDGDSQPSGSALPTVAALPDGAGLLVQTAQGTQLRSADGGRVLQTDTGIEGRLMANSVSPDGTQVASGIEPGWEARGEVLTVSTLHGGRLSTSTDLEVAGEESVRTVLLGWLDRHTLLLSDTIPDTDGWRQDLRAVDVRDGSAHTLVPGEPNNNVAITSAASALLDGAVVEQVPSPDVGWGPMLFRAGAWAAGLTFVGWALLTVWRALPGPRRRRAG